MNRRLKQTSSTLRTGNALILVIGILVLLVLVATAFITRVQSGRVTTSAQRDSAEITDQARSVGRFVADEISLALFCKEVTPATSIGSANEPRRAPSPDALRYGSDNDVLGDGVNPKPFNFAPYEVVPWTNPPDPSNGGSVQLGPLNPLGGPSFGDSRWLRDTEPQRGDVTLPIDGTPETFTHWRHLTNLSRSGNAWRIARDISDITDADGDGNGGLLTDLDVPVEQWPTVRPLRGTDLELSNTSNTVGQYPALSSTSGQEHFTIMKEWFDGTASTFFPTPQYQNRIPQNFLDLSDLNGDGLHNREGERALDGFTKGTLRWYVERTMTDTDGDGFTDAFWHLSPQSLGSDTMQLVAVSITDNSARGNMNVATKFERNDSSSGYQDGEETKGHTPADIALVGDESVGFLDNPANSPGASNMSWVEYYGLSDSTVSWDPGQWSGSSNASVLGELGIEIHGSTPNPNLKDISPAGNLSSTNNIYSSYGRRWYWQLAGRDPFSATNGFRPYTTADELELRIVEGNNYQFVGSRLERSLNSVDSSDTQFLRSSYGRHEATELRDQLNNKQLVFDNRRKLTVFSGARNDLLPPWLRWEERFWQRHELDGTLPKGYNAFKLESYNNDFQLWGSLFPPAIAQEVGEALADNGSGDPIEMKRIADFIVNTWREQSRSKVDLREYYAPVPSGFGGEFWWESNKDGKLTLSQRAPLQIFLAMTDAQEKGVSSLDYSGLPSNAPLGTYTDPEFDAPWSTVVSDNYYQQARLMSAGLASNIMSYLDKDDRWRDHSPFSVHVSGVTSKVETPLSSAVPPPVLGNNGWELEEEGEADRPYADVPVLGPNDGDVMMLGLEAQPFIMEAFIGHAHGAETEEYAPGACCLDGFCEVMSEPTCVALNGIFEGSENCLLANCEFGACCLEDGGCIVMRPSNCIRLLGDYRGDGTDCESIRCLGQCCQYMGDCEELSYRSCTELGGAFAGYETQCAGDCQTMGACCIESGSCVDVLFQEACTSLGGTYQGSQFCDTDPCLAPCCLNYTQCVNLTVAACVDMGGQPSGGSDQLCTELSCSSTGACCVGSESCTDVAVLAECMVIGGDYLEGTYCQEWPCNASCCLEDGTCVEISLGGCLTLEGTYIQNYICDESPCRSACCFWTGGCEVMLQETCDLFGGKYKAGEYCADSPCVPVGACCFNEPDHGCLDGVDEDICEVELGGEWTAEGVLCSSVPCNAIANRGACCFDTGYCQDDISGVKCNDLGGVFQGALIICDEDPCAPKWACCLGNATCLDLMQQSCDDLGGDFNIGQTCAEVDDICALACCLPDDSCTDMLALDCLDNDGEPKSGLTCDTEPCLPTGACCISNAFCDDVTEDMCILTLGGEYEGDDTNCDSDPCALGFAGACCLEQLGCVLVIDAICQWAGGFWEASGTCELATCSVGSCCLDNGSTANCVDTASASSCDYLGGIYTPGELCDTDPCVGACCLWAGGCEMMSKESCDNLIDNGAPGRFQGVGEPCGPVQCSPAVGSCCLMSDTCVDILGDRDFLDYCVVDLGGIYRPGEYCASSECGGACCLPFTHCSPVPEEQCIELGGTYAGDGVSCLGLDQLPDTGDEPCVFAGACCFGSGSCIDVSEENHCQNLGGTYKEGEECADSPCRQYFIVDDKDEGKNLWSDFQGTYAVVQLANPFNRLIDLKDYSVEFFGKEFKFDSIITPGIPDPTSLLLPPATPENPATLILYAFPDDATMPDTSIFTDPTDPIAPDLNADWKDFLDIEETDHPQDDVNTIDDPFTVPIEGVEKTLLIKVPSATSANPDMGWETTRGYYDNLQWDKDDIEFNAIALYKFDNDQRVLIDRIDAPRKQYDSVFASRVSDTLETQWNKVGDSGYVNTLIPFKPNTESILVHWDRVTRAWGVDIPIDGGWENDTYDATERNPRYVFSSNDFIRNGDDLEDPLNPDDREFNGRRRITGYDYSDSEEFLEYSSEFHWTEFQDPDDFDGSGEMDDDSVLPADDDNLTDNPDPWFATYLWHPMADDENTYDGLVNGGFRNRKPTFFDMNRIENPPFPDKGWYGQSLSNGLTSTNSVLPAYIDSDGSNGIDYPILPGERRELYMDLTFPLQMLQKDDDFEQVGELLNVWLFGHMLEGNYFPPLDSESYEYNLELPQSHLDGGTQVDAGTITTFSEFMYPNWQVEDWWAPWVGVIDEDDKLVLDERVNRLRFIPQGVGGEDSAKTPLMMGGRSIFDPVADTVDAINHPWPRQPIATRILDSFVCDGPGRLDYDGDGEDDDLWIGGSEHQLPSVHSFYNANGFSGKATPGMININTAPVEVLRMLPHMYKVVHRTSDTGDGSQRSAIPEAMVQWREGSNGGDTDRAYDTGIPRGTDYSDRTETLEMEFGTGPKQTRGFSSPGEIGLLRPVDPNASYSPWSDVGEPWEMTRRSAKAWRIDFASLEPFDPRDLYDEDFGAHISTDVNRADYYGGEHSEEGDGVSGDAEEKNLLQAGISNLISTNSDMFTVHMRIRTFKRNPITATWDATDLDYIIDDSRYVMLVDRSNVNTPADKPTIIYFEKLPN